MEIDVTHMVEDCDEMPMLSGSRAELGENAGKLTWNNSIAYGNAKPLLASDADREAAREHFAEYGAWSDEEIAAWSDADLQGLMVQEVAAAIREMEGYDSNEEFEKACEEGQCSGRLGKGDNGRWYFYVGS